MFACLIVMLFLGSVARGSESFESLPVGNATEIDTAYGKMSASGGTMEICGKAKSGSKALRICGGKGREAVLTLKETPVKGTAFTSWAERWTGRKPFSFRIFALSSSGEKEIYNGDSTITTGSFPVKIEAILPEGCKSLRFLADSPDGSGVLMDEWNMVIPVPMSMGKVSSSAAEWPVMVRRKDNLVARIEVGTEGALNPLRVDSVLVDFTGTDVKDMESVEVVAGGEIERDALSSPTAEPIRNFTDLGKVKIPVNIELLPGQNYLWVNVRLKDKADLDRKIVLKPLEISVNEKPVKIEGASLISQRIGYVFGQDGDKIMPSGQSCRFFRIPGVVKTGKGTLVAACDIRYTRLNDLPSDIDVGIARSTDGGKSWSPVSVAMPFVNSIPGHKGTGNGDAAILYDEKTGRLWMAALWSNGVNPIWGPQGTNDPGKKCGQFLLAYSDDDGLTWSKAINITDQVKKPEWGANFQGPGTGICLRDGTLVFPCQFWFDVNGQRKAHSSLIYSKDGGKSWDCGTACYPGTSEAQVVELEDGSIMINARNENRTGYRIVCVTKDLGKTWTVHPTSNNGNGKGLAEPPSACQGSILAVPGKGGVNRALFFSNPTHFDKDRKNMMLRVSLDQGDTWPKENSMRYDERRGWGYSSLVPIDEEHIGVLYEGRGVLFFLRIPYAELLGKDSNNSLR